MFPFYLLNPLSNKHLAENSHMLRFSWKSSKLSFLPACLLPSVKSSLSHLQSLATPLFLPWWCFPYSWGQCGKLGLSSLKKRKKCPRFCHSSPAIWYSLTNKIQLRCRVLELSFSVDFLFKSPLGIIHWYSDGIKKEKGINSNGKIGFHNCKLWNKLGRKSSQTEIFEVKDASQNRYSYYWIGFIFILRWYGHLLQLLISMSKSPHQLDWEITPICKSLLWVKVRVWYCLEQEI